RERAENGCGVCCAFFFKSLTIFARLEVAFRLLSVRIAVVSDIHGNKPALDAVLAEIEREPVDRLVCLGDVAVGPQPGAALDRIAETGCPVSVGNWDAAFLNGLLVTEGGMGEMLLQHAGWAA